MNDNRPVYIACLAVSLLACRVSLSAAPGAGAAATAAEAAVREADADWAEMARTGSVDAWMAFYADHAIVMPPNSPLLSDKDLVRQMVANLLKRPHLSIVRHPIKVEVAASGDLAYLIGTYELAFEDSRGSPAAERGKILEIWRKQPDGRWRCSVDTWNSDEAATVSESESASAGSRAAALPPVPAALQAPASGAVPAALQPAASVSADSQRFAAAPAAADSAIAAIAPAPAAPQAAVKAQARASSSPFGDVPVHYEDAIRQYFQDHLADPESIRYQQITAPETGHATVITGGVLMRETQLSGWIVKATIDAKNSHSKYVESVTYTFLFKGEKIIHVDQPRG